MDISGHYCGVGSVSVACWEGLVTIAKAWQMAELPALKLHSMSAHGSLHPLINMWLNSWIVLLDYLSLKENIRIFLKTSDLGSHLSIFTDTKTPNLYKNLPFYFSNFFPAVKYPLKLPIVDNLHSNKEHNKWGNPIYINEVGVDGWELSASQISVVDLVSAYQFLKSEYSHTSRL